MKRELMVPKDIISLTEIKFLLKPILFLGIVILSIVLVIVFGLKQVKKLQNQTADATKNQSTLLKKVEVLSQVDELIPQGLDFVNLALPSQNAVIYALSQVKTVADRNALLVSNVRSGGNSETKGITKISLNFEVTGPQSAMYLFLEEISKSLPVMVIEKVKINTEGGTSKATVAINVYGADLPKKIPSLTTAVSGLSTEEVTLLNELSSYSQPSFSTLEVQEGSTREDPFN